MNGAHEQQLSSPTAQKWEWVCVVCLAVLLFNIGTLFYLYAFYTAPENMAFMGLIGKGAVGGWGYFMFASQAEQGRFFMENLMTPETQERLYFNLEWWGLGVFARFSGLSLTAAYHVWRFASILALLSAVYYLCIICLNSVRLRMLALTVIIFGSGLGWVVRLINILFVIELPEPPDLGGVSIPLYLIFKPHFIRAAVLATLTVACLIRGEQTRWLRWFAVAAAAVFLHTVLRPYPIPEVLLLCLCAPVLSWLHEKQFPRHLMYYGIPLGALAPAALYYAWLIRDNVLGFSWWNPAHLLFLQDILWMGLPMLGAFSWLALNGLYRAFRRSCETRLLGLWLIVALGINQMYPYFDGGHENCFSAFAIASPILLARLFERYRLNTRHESRCNLFARPGVAFGCAVLLITATIPSTILACHRLVHSLHIHSERYYAHHDVLDAVAWLAEQNTPGSVVLSLPNTAQFIPALSQHRVVAAHFMLTNRWDEKSAEVYQFFHTTIAHEYRKQLLKKYNVAYVLLGPEERALSGNSLDDMSALTPMFVRENATLFAVNPSRL